MGKIVVAIVVNAIALWAAARFVPGFDWPAVDELQELEADTLLQVGVIGLIFAVINTVIRPAVKILSFPVTFLTLGLFGLVINGAMLLLLATLSENFGARITIGGYPPDLSFDAIGTAIVAAIVVSIVSTIVSLALNRLKS